METKKPSLFMHIGLHKTGTTSIQYVCNNNRHLLDNFGIVYPYDPELTLGTQLHLGITKDISSAERLLVRCSNVNCSYVLISNEGFGASLAELSDFDLQNFFKNIYSCYADVIWVVSVRNDRDLLASASREFLDGSAFPMQGIDQFLNSHVEKIKKLADSLIGRNKKIIDLDDIRNGENWPSYFLSRVFDISIQVPDAHQNSRGNKTISSLFSPIFRSFYHNTLAEHYYSLETSQATERALATISLDAAFESEFSKGLDDYIQGRVDMFIKDPNFVPTKNFFTG